MIKSLLVLILLIISFPTKAYDVEVRYVYDGDTIMINLPQLPHPLSNASVRIIGIDAPEIKGKCQAERDLAVSAKMYIKHLIGFNKVISISGFSWDKYGGRIDANVYVNGINVAEELIANNLARPYYGGARRSWCTN